MEVGNVASEQKRLRAWSAQLREEAAKLRDEREKFEREAEIVAEFNKRVSKILKLNVGGRIFTTTQATLTSVEESMLSAMFSGRYNLKTDEKGRIFLDRDPEVFHYGNRLSHLFSFSSSRLP